MENVIKFKNLPEIPIIKRWIEGKKITKEQELSFKLIQGNELTENEKNEFLSTFEFYNNLNSELQKIDYSKFSENDISQFKKYLDYAFNYIPLISNELTVFQTYRLIVNEWVIQKNERINEVKYLKYPPLEIVNKIGKYNRANSPQTNVFYTAENIDTALIEIKPPVNKLITVGKWKLRSEKKLNSYPISHSENAIKINQGVKKATDAIEKLAYNENYKLLIEWVKHYFSLLGREFTKPVNHHYEYIISALFSERILRSRNNSNKLFNYDCIIYPSVNNNFGTDNLAVLPEVVDNDFVLDKVIEFEIEETYFDNKYVPNLPETITMAKVKNLSYTQKIINNENIIW